MGWAKIAYTHGLRELRELIQKEKSQKNIMSADTFEKVLEKILSLKGDTDTNGAIVGGLIGAVVGFKNLPNTYLKNQFKLRLQLDRDQYGSRGSEYEPRREFLKAISLIQKFESYKHKQVNWFSFHKTFIKIVKLILIAIKYCELNHKNHGKPTTFD